MWFDCGYSKPFTPPPRGGCRDTLTAEQTKSDSLTDAEEDSVRQELSQKYPGFREQVEIANQKYGPQD